MCYPVIADTRWVTSFGSRQHLTKLSAWYFHRRVVVAALVVFLGEPMASWRPIRQNGALSMWRRVFVVGSFGWHVQSEILCSRCASEVSICNPSSPYLFQRYQRIERPISTPCRAQGQAKSSASVIYCDMISVYIYIFNMYIGIYMYIYMYIIYVYMYILCVYIYICIYVRITEGSTHPNIHRDQ